MLHLIIYHKTHFSARIMREVTSYLNLNILTRYLYATHERRAHLRGHNNLFILELLLVE